jgi:general secretion pathway protein N
MKKSRWLLYGIFGLVFYLLFFIIEMPASWFAWGLNRYTQGTVRLDPIAGSLWSGNGRLVIYYPQTRPHDFGQTEWSIKPFWLLTGRVQLTLQANTPERQIKTTLGIAKGSLSIKDTDATFPASFVGQLYPPATLIGPQGQVRLRTSDIVFGQQNLEGSATLEWQGAGSSLSNVQPLGDYRLDITGAGKTADLKLTTQRGDLELTGQGQWQLANGQIQFTGMANSQKREKELESLMQLLGNDMGSGRRSFSIAYRLPL